MQETTKLDKISLAQTTALQQVIKEEIKKNDNVISFREFMRLALYYPHLGYYSCSKEKVSSKGDFITATTQSPIFAMTFAQQFSKIIDSLNNDCSIVEFGAGSGRFAVDCITHLKRLKKLPTKYIIVELSNDLRERQKELILKEIPNLYNNFEWILKLPKKKQNAIIFANELLDAMPIDLFRAEENNNISQLGVTFCNNKNEFQLKRLNSNDELFKNEITKILNDDISFSKNYMSELNVWIKPWLSSIKDFINKGVIFLCDYGYPRNIYYMPERNMGTLACYYNHTVNYNPFDNVGLQDITAHVDFTSVAENADSLGFILDGFMAQGNFLKNAKAVEIFQSIRQHLTKEQNITYTNDIKDLLLNNKLSEVFKVFCCSLNYDDVLDVFNCDDNIEYLL